MRCGHEWHASLETWGGVLSELFNNQTRRRRERAIIIGCWGSNGGDGTGVLIVSVIGVVHGDVVVGPPVFHGVFPLAINAKQQEFRNGLSWDECILVSHLKPKETFRFTLCQMALVLGKENAFRVEQLLYCPRELQKGWERLGPVERRND